jgi:hypothetical protein
MTNKVRSDLDKAGQDKPAFPSAALAVSVLLFAAIYIWGFIMSVTEMTQKSTPASPGAPE